MELHALQVFATVVAERSFSRAAEKLLPHPAGGLAGGAAAGERSSARS